MPENNWELVNEVKQLVEQRRRVTRAFLVQFLLNRLPAVEIQPFLDTLEAGEILYREPGTNICIVHKDGVG